MNKSPLVIVICGPTGTGKTALAITLAQALGTEIISADSRQIYREFTIGTAKPTQAEQGGIPHHLLDIVDPAITYTVAQYQKAASGLIQDLHAAGKIPLLVGGTGLYIDAVTAGLTLPSVPPNPTLRAELAHLSSEELYLKVQPLAPHIHAHDRVRLLRALEVFLTLGYLPERTAQAPDYRIVWIGLDYPALISYTRQLTERTHNMLAQGWLQEIESLQARYGADLPLLQTLGYAEMSRYLMGAWDEATAIERTVIRTRQYAKRQRTWFRRYPVRWFDRSVMSIERITEQILRDTEEFTQPIDHRLLP